MRVGTIAYCSEQGLGYLARSFYQNGVVNQPLLCVHSSRISRYDWYPKTTMAIPVREMLAINQDVARFIRSVDVMLFFETPFDWQIIGLCRSIGVKTALMPMHECMPRGLPAVPDLLVCPSALDYECYKTHPGVKVVHIPVPVDTPWRLRTQAVEFVHNAGNGGLRGRNGTMELLDAWKYVKSNARLHVRSQCMTDEEVGVRCGVDPRITFETGTVPDERLYASGDVFIFPEKFNGLSLPLQEAHAAGMLVMATNRFPNNIWLPTDPLIQTVGSHKARVGPSCREFDEAELDPQVIARKVDAWWGVDITHYSALGREYAKANSWDVLRPQYLAALRSL